MEIKFIMVHCYWEMKYECIIFSPVNTGVCPSHGQTLDSVISWVKGRWQVEGHRVSAPRGHSGIRLKPRSLDEEKKRRNNCGEGKQLELEEEGGKRRWCRLKRCTIWEMWAQFYLGQNEDCSLGDSTSDSSERLFQRGCGGRSKYKIVVKG